MVNDTENYSKDAALKPTPPEQDALMGNEENNGGSAEYVDELVHVDGEGASSSAQQQSSIDDVNLDALVSLTPTIPQGRKLSRKEKKAAKRELKAARREMKKKDASKKQNYKSINKQLKERDKELSSRAKALRGKRSRAKDVVAYLGYDRMYVDGVCEVEEGMFSETIEFADTSYHSVRDDVQKGIFSTMTRLYDAFGADTLLQLNVINTPLLAEEIGSRKFFDPNKQTTENAANDAVVFNNILNDKMKQGVSNIRRKRYLTYSVSAEGADEAVVKLSRIEATASRILNSIKSETHLLDGTERLRVLHSQLNPYKPFDFDYQRDVGFAACATTKDAIAPNVIDFKPDGFTDCFKMDGVWGQVLVMRKFGAELSDRALADIVDLPIPMNVTWFVQPIDKAKAIAYARQRSAWIDKEIIEEQRSAVNKGYDFSILPYELKYAKDDCENLLDHLQNKNQRLFVFTGLVYTYAPDKRMLDNQIMRIISAARQNSIELDIYDLRQREAFNSVLPLGNNHIDTSRMFTSAQVGILMPFATQELDDAGGNYYGQNKASRNLIFCNRKRLASPVGFVCGKTGSGKGMFTKAEMTGTIFSNPTDEIYVVDRAGEYTEIARRYGGSVFHFGVGSGSYLNPFDTVSVEHMSFEEQIAFKIDAMLAQAGATSEESGAKLSEEEQSIIARCVELAFARASDRGDGKPPLLSDFHQILMEQPESDARRIALRYERFTTGTMGFFNRHTTVDFNSRIVDFDLKDLPDTMLVFALINVCEAVRNRMYANHARGIRTWLYVEEIQSMFKYPTVLNYFSRFANEGRKFGLLLTGITQSASAMFGNENARNIISNADFIMLLKQSPIDRANWVNLLNLSEQEEECIDETVEAGDGLLIAGAARIPVSGKFPKGNVLYDLFSTNPNEKAERMNNARL